MNQFRIGSLYPVDQYGAPNIFLSSGYTLGTDENGYYVRDNGISNGTLKTTLEITTEPVEIKNIFASLANVYVSRIWDYEEKSLTILVHIDPILTILVPIDSPHLDLSNGTKMLKKWTNMNQVRNQ